MRTFILMAIALMPAVFLCVYVYRKDRIEKEPIALLLRLFFLGALSCFPASLIEVVLGKFISAVFVGGPLMFLAVENTLGVALVEEGLKLLVLIWVTQKNKDYNSSFDGLIYAAFVSLGFAALENIFYVFEYGIRVGIMRAVLSVPGHLFFSVMMGYQYSLWHIADKAAVLEKKLKEQGIIEAENQKISSVSAKTKCLLIPVLAHGFYNTCCSTGTTLGIIVLYAFVIFMYVHCFRRIKDMSNADASENKYAMYLLLKKYPQLIEYIKAKREEKNPVH